MAGFNVVVANGMLGIISAVLFLFFLYFLSHFLCNRYIRRQISIMRNHPHNQPVTSGPFAPSTDPDNPNPFAIYGGIYNAECDRLTAILEDKSWMGLKRDGWVVGDLGRRLYCRAWSVMLGVSEWFKLLWRLLSRDRKKRREEQLRSAPLVDGEESGRHNG